MLFAATVSVVACSGLFDPSYFQSPKQEWRVASAARTGDALWFAAASLTVRRSDRVDLLGTALVDPRGDLAVTEVVVSPNTSISPLNGRIGNPLVPEADIPVELVAAGHALSGARLDWQTPGLLILRVEPQSAGAASFRGVTLRFRINDGPTESQTFGSSLVLCVGDPIPDGCSSEIPSDAEPRH